MKIDNKLTLDLETLPSDSTALLATMRANVKPPGQYKKADSIAQWMAENSEAAALEEFGKTGLDGLYGRICVAGYAIGAKPVVALRLDAYDSERIFLERLFATLDIDADKETSFIEIITLKEPETRWGRIVYGSQWLEDEGLLFVSVDI